MDKIKELEKELEQVQINIDELCSYYNPKASQNHYSEEINDLLTRERNIRINLNQLRQKK